MTGVELSQLSVPDFLSVKLEDATIQFFYSYTVSQTPSSCAWSRTLLTAHASKLSSRCSSCSKVVFSLVPVIFVVPSLVCVHFVVPSLVCVHFVVPSLACVHFVVPSLVCVHFVVPSLVCVHFVVPSLACVHFVVPSLVRVHFVVPSLVHVHFVVRSFTAPPDFFPVRVNILCFLLSGGGSVVRTLLYIRARLLPFPLWPAYLPLVHWPLPQ